MKVNEDDILELCLSGGGINPTALKASEVADLITEYERSLLRVIERDHAEINLEEVFISLIDVQENSAHYRFVPNVKNVVFAAAATINTAIATQAIGTLPYKTVEHLGEIWKFTKEKNCQAEFTGKSLPKAVIVPEVPIQISKDFFFEGETTIYGKIERVGGSAPKVRVKLDNDDVLYLEVDESLAKKLANRLYESIALKGMAKWRKHDYRIEDFKIEAVQHFEAGKITEAMKELRGSIGAFWDKVGNIDDYILNARYEKEDY
jgi:hypothetical protein